MELKSLSYSCLIELRKELYRLKKTPARERAIDACSEEIFMRTAKFRDRFRKDDEIPGQTSLIDQEGVDGG